MDRSQVNIAGRRIGRGQPCYVIAEIGVNHNGDAGLAHRLIDEAKEASADAVKFQVFSADALAMASASKAAYQEKTTGAGSQRDMLRALELSPDAFRRLKDHCDSVGMTFLCSPFDDGSLGLLDALDVAAIKIPSGELTNTPFLARVARMRRPIILSTGMANLEEVGEAVRVLDGDEGASVVLLHCVSAYPTPYEEINLRAMQTLSDRFARPVGFSDHSIGTSAAIGAVALSACVIEKHLTIDSTFPGPDHATSLVPNEFRSMVQSIRHIEAALGDGRKVPRKVERETARVARKSLHARRAIACGATLAESDVIIARPETGLPPRMLPLVIGRTLARSVADGDPLVIEDFA